MHETWEAFARTIHFATPGRIAYAILDARLYEIAGYQRAIRSEVPPYQAASIAELAALIDVPAAALQETVARYNAAATGDAGAVRCDAHRRACGRSRPLAAEIELGRARWTGRPISPIR